MNRLCVPALIQVLLIPMLVAGCGRSTSDGPVRSAGSIMEIARDDGVSCDADNGGLTLPDGFCALVVADSLGRARHLAVRSNGDVYVALRQPANGGGIVGLRDADGDGRSDQVVYFGKLGGTGIHVRGNYLYFAPNRRIERYALAEDALLPSGPPETVVGGFPNQRQHATKPFAFDEAGNLYVNVGAPSNACQDPSRTPGAAGEDPCSLLEHHGGIWEFRADAVRQTYDDGHRYATGIRNGVAIAWNPFTDKLYVVQHGRDQLGSLWPNLYTDAQSAELPAEEFLEVDDGDDFGWPYCYYDQLQEKKVLAPEYGGDGSKVGRCAQKKNPIMAFPGHWAPNDLVFYGGRQFPARYSKGAFIAFHGSWNRAPLPQQGYKVVFVPFAEGNPTGSYEVFADGFAGPGPIASSGDARFRPMGLAVGPDGSLYISDSVVGRIWRVVYSPH